MKAAGSLGAGTNTACTHTPAAHGVIYVMAREQARRWCFTLNNNWDDTELSEIKNECKRVAKFAIIAKEVGENRTHHLQGYTNFKNPMRFTKVKGITGVRAHIENARGSYADNDRYCSKEDPDTWRFGTPQTPGQRNDLHTAVDAVRDMLLREVADLMPTTYIKYHRGIQHFKNLVAPPKPKDFKTEVR